MDMIMMANSHLLALPFVVQDHILSYLTLPEQLHVRRVCRTTKDWVDRSRFRLAEHIPASVVRGYGHGGRHPFIQFMSKRIPHLITSIHLDNQFMETFQDSRYLRDFLYCFTESITTVRLARYFISNGNDKEIRFLERLTKMESLEVEEIWISSAESISTRIPETFRRLTSLKLGQVIVFDEASRVPLEQNEVQELHGDRKKILRWHVWNILEICERLTHLKVPISPKSLFENSFDECFRLLNYIRIRTRGITERGFRAQQFIMQCDLYNFNCCTSSLEVLLIVGSRMRIQFLNVNSKVFKRGSSFCVVGIPPRARFDYIHSFISSSLVNRNFDYIQKLTFKASLIQNECIIGREKGPTLFPNLREFHIILDIGFDILFPSSVYSRTIVHENDAALPRNVCFPRADQVLRFFFPANMPYNLVHTLSIEFCDPVFPHQKRARPEKLATLPVIINGLPNVTDLTIKGWNCTRNVYLNLWYGFSKLEKLIIDSCSTLSPSCFISGNGSPNNPSNFRFLPNLEYIELAGLEEMPGVANRVTGQKDQMKEVFAKLGFMQSDYLSRNDYPRKVVWMRPNPTAGWPGVSHSTIVTRSVAKSMKSKRKVITRSSSRRGGQ